MKVQVGSNRPEISTWIQTISQRRDPQLQRQHQPHTSMFSSIMGVTLLVPSQRDTQHDVTTASDGDHCVIYLFIVYLLSVTLIPSQFWREDILIRPASNLLTNVGASGLSVVDSAFLGPPRCGTATQKSSRLSNAVQYRMTLRIGSM